jgi:hypothetical protein
MAEISASQASQGSNFELDFHSSEDENNHRETIVTKTKKKRGESKVYNEYEIYETKEEAEAVIAREKIWSKRNKKTTLEGVKQFYRCNKPPSRAEQCATGLYLLYHAENQRVSIYRTTCSHTCIPRRLKVPQETRDAIKLMYESGIRKPKLIVENLEKIPTMQIPWLKDLYNYLATLKSKIFGQTAMDLGKLAQFCDDNEQLPPEDQLDQPFVVSYQTYVDVDESEPLPEGYEKKEDIFRLFISTRR